MCIRDRSKSKRKSRSRFSVRRDGRKGGPKYERCVLAVKSRQPKICFRRGKWVGGKKCVRSPWAICTARVGRYN